MKNAPVARYIYEEDANDAPADAWVDDWGAEKTPKEPMVRYVRADLVTPLIEALLKINDGLREHDRVRLYELQNRVRLYELQIIAYRALAAVQEGML